MKKVILKPGREKALLRKHFWVFSGSIETFPSFEDGDILEVVSSDQKFLGLGYFQAGGSIVGHMLSFAEDKEKTIESILRKRIQEAYQKRKSFFSSKETNAYRVIHSEGDGIPGLVVDLYDDILVFQVSTRGIERQKELILKLLIETIPTRAIYEKSTSSLRKKEGLKEVQGWVWKEGKTEIVICENGLLFPVHLEKGQKTGFFFDQREMRKWMEELSFGKNVLNCFAYTGGFSLYALRGGAKQVQSVELSDFCCEKMKEGTLLNQFPIEKHQIFSEDVFSFLSKREKLDADLLILDPPAFAKKQGDVTNALRGYKELNALAMKKLPEKSLLLTCSCSSYIDEKSFQEVLFQAALSAGREVSIVGKHRQAFDHPISLYHPESVYLKSFLLLLGR